MRKKVQESFDEKDRLRQIMKKQEEERNMLQSSHEEALNQAENTLQREKELLEAQLTEGNQTTQAA